MKKELLTRFMEKRIVELKKEQRNGTAHVYQSTLNRLKNFMNGREITFSQLTPEWLALFEQKLLADQLKWNTISTYMRMLRSVYNQALERGVATEGGWGYTGCVITGKEEKYGCNGIGVRRPQ